MRLLVLIDGVQVLKTVLNDAKIIVETDDDRQLHFTYTHEGVIVDGIFGDGDAHELGYRLYEDYLEAMGAEET